MKTIMLVFFTLFFVFIIPVAFSENITINTNKEQFTGGDVVEIEGSVENGIAGDFVALEIKDPEGKTILIRTVTLGDGGSFFLKFKIPESGTAGSYDIVVNSQQGEKAISETKTIIQTSPEPEPESNLVCGKGTIEKDGICVVDTTKPTVEKSSKGGGCLIATAAYGSEMAPQVQLLREIRDNKLMSTQSGVSFMTGFNQFYYSFSPTIADMERENPMFKELIKIGITPMLTSLSIMSAADSEQEVLTYGIGVILMNVGMYFVAPVVVVHAIRKKF